MQSGNSENVDSEGIIDKLIDYELVSKGAAYFSNGEYESAIVGVTDDGCFVYDFLEDGRLHDGEQRLQS